MKRTLLWVPLLTFILIIGIAAVALIKPANRDVKSANSREPLVVGKPA